jgi:outer membrane beta-barrel protein
MKVFANSVLIFSALLFAAAGNAAEEAPLSDEEILTPKVKREDVKPAKIDTEDFEVGVFGGIYSIEDFGTNVVVGARLSFHITDTFFVQASGGQTKGDKTAIEELLNTEFLTDEERTLTYYNLAFGYKIFPGEAFVGANWAYVSSFYVIAGAGNTEFGDEDRFTINAGFGYNLLITDWLAVQFDFKDHIFEQDLLGVEKTTHNLELSGGFSVFF